MQKTKTAGSTTVGGNVKAATNTITVTISTLYGIIIRASFPAHSIAAITADCAILFAAETAGALFFLVGSKF